MRMNVLFLSILLWSLCIIRVKTELKKFVSEDLFDDWDDYSEEITNVTTSTQQQPSHVNFLHEVCQYYLLNLFSSAYPLNNASSEGKIRLLVRFRGKSDVYIFLSQQKHLFMGPHYSILIGADKNQLTMFDRNLDDRVERNLDDRVEHLARINTPNILSEHHYNGFIVEYNTVTGHLSLLSEKSQVPILHYIDPKPLDIKFFSFLSLASSSTDVAFNCVGRDALSLVPSETLIVNRTSALMNAELVRAKLLENYDNKVIPVQENDDPTKVGVGITVNYFTLEEAEHVFIVNAWMRLSWKDPRLVFNSTTTGGAMLRFGSDELWKPDITLYNNAYPTEIDHYGDTHMLVSPDGSVLWVPPARLAGHCSLNMIRWPYDTHTCELKFGSWTHHGKEIDLFYPNTLVNDSDATQDFEIEHTHFVSNSEWRLLKNSAARNAIFYACCSEPYIDLTFSFTFQRNSSSYVAIFVIPIIFIALVNMLVFLLPPAAGEKLTLGVVHFAILCLYLLYFQAKIPPLGDHLPLLVLLYVINLVLVSISLAISVIVLNLSRTKRASTLPQCLRIFCNVHFATVLGLGHLVPFVSKTHNRLDEGVELRSPNQSSSETSGRWHADMNGSVKDEPSSNLVDYDVPYMLNAEWILLATMIDRVAFVVYGVVNVIILALCLG